ncbi:MAG TPA: 50S ribosomal protein L3 N(5)-glutamine methyltransferase [Gammaproteobacteria bacterium]
MSQKPTIRELIRDTEKRFRRAKLHYGHGTETALDDAAFLVLRALGLSPATDGAELDGPVPPADAARIAALVDRRVSERIPTAYLLSEAWFAGLPFHVDPRVLIPRSPFAELIEERFSPWVREEHVRRVLDIGTGSGCMAVACALAFPAATVDAVDVSPGALEVAKRNVERHGVGDRVHCIRSDVFDALAGRRYDLIVANPPYVGAAEYASLPPEYRHEPRDGLESGADGLDVVRRLLRGAAAHLEPRGVLIAEVGGSASLLEEAFPRVPFVWAELERGGDGIFILSRDDLVSAFAPGAGSG